MIPYIQIHIPSIFGFHIEPFGILVFIGCMVGIHYAKKRAAERRLDPRVIDDIAMYCCILAGFLGAHLFHFLAYDPHTFFKNPMVFFTQFRSGLSSMGGFLTAAAAIVIYLRMKKLPFMEYGEAILFGLLPGWIFGRLGCTTAHDHPGKRTDFWLGVKYPDGIRHDLGFYEFLFTIVMTVIVYGLAAQKKDRPVGFYLAISLLMYSVVRFFMDYLRVADAKYAGLTPAQYACIGVGIYSIYLFKKVTEKKG
ncbi:MAG: prolipoprotein diacylglyceryl transferase [Bdellovibrionota bacterium]